MQAPVSNESALETLTEEHLKHSKARWCKSRCETESFISKFYRCYFNSETAETHAFFINCIAAGFPIKRITYFYAKPKSDVFQLSLKYAAKAWLC